MIDEKRKAMLNAPICWESAVGAFRRGLGVNMTVEDLKKICAERGIKTGKQLSEAVVDIAKMFFN